MAVYPAENPQKQAPASPDIQSWARLARAWPDLSPDERRTCLNAAADALHDAWEEGWLPGRIPLHLLAFERSNGTLRARFPDFAVERSLRATPMNVLDLLADWRAQTDDVVSPREALHFLRVYFRKEHADGAALRHAAESIIALARRHARIEAAVLYRAALRDPVRRASGGILRGHWAADPRMGPEELRAQIEAAESCTDAAVLKDSGHIRVVRAPLLGQDALIKRYDIVSWRDRIKYQVRPSRARRAWAAAKCLLRLGIRTPELLGYLEIYSGRVPARSYIVTRFMPDAMNAYLWIKRNWRRHDQPWRDAFRRDLLGEYLQLYRKGIYHSDTKLPNVMIEAPEDAALRKFYWIDLEGVLAGVTPTRHQVVRNLVQLNGSLRNWVSEEDRLAFLSEFAQTYPWANSPRVIERVRRWSRRRLLNELHRHVGP
jgi:hypothetical protein